MFPCRLRHVVDSMNDKTRWLEAIGAIGEHYLVMLRNAGDGISSHVHAVKQCDYVPTVEPMKSVKSQAKKESEHADDTPGAADDFF